MPIESPFFACAGTHDAVEHTYSRFEAFPQLYLKSGKKKYMVHDAEVMTTDSGLIVLKPNPHLIVSPQRGRSIGQISPVTFTFYLGYEWAKFTSFNRHTIIECYYQFKTQLALGHYFAGDLHIMARSVCLMFAIYEYYLRARQIDRLPFHFQLNPATDSITLYEQFATDETIWHPMYRYPINETF